MKATFFKLTDPQKFHIMYRLVLLNETSLLQWITPFEEEFAAELAERAIRAEGKKSIKRAYAILRGIAAEQFSCEASEKQVYELEAVYDQLSELSMWLEDIDETFPAYAEREYAPLVALVEFVELVAEYDVDEGPMDDTMAERVYRIIYLASIGSGNKEIPDSAVPGIKGEGAFHYYFNDWADFNQFYPENEKLHKNYIVPQLTKMIAQV